MNVKLVGIGGIDASMSAGEAVKTLALGSCVAVIILDPMTHCVAMVHVALPDSKVSIEKAQLLPGYFADTGIVALLEFMKRTGASGNTRKYIVKLVGGANVADTNNTFNIGKRNALAIKKVLWQFGMGAVAEDLGGSISRTVTVDVNAGSVLISSPRRPDWSI